jgi:hypothetical protein
MISLSTAEPDSTFTWTVADRMGWASVRLYRFTYHGN